ncbi:MAG: substrate-binding domain-containing protein [Clostridiales bacterium]|jgi:phosphate transport system substrate-binding protein|nr:substrate-binding domain-containing protein [Clostridiales bacterium]
MGIKKQLAVLCAVAGAFVLFNYSIYTLFTYRYIDNAPQLMIEKSIELDQYLPFDENSKIVRQPSELRLGGDLPVLDGATALFPVYSAFMHALYPAGSAAFDRRDFTPKSFLQKRGTEGAYQAVVEGSADVIFVAQPSEEQKKQAETAGADLVYEPIGSEAFVFIVNAKNPVSALSTEEIQGIYSGEYKNWQQLGGTDDEIIPLQRAENSGSQTAMRAFMADKPLAANAIHLRGRAIGYSFRFYVSALSGKDNVKMLSVNGVYPSEENIRNGTYPVTEHFYAVYRKDNGNKNIPLLIDWILSDEGQRIINQMGYVGL